MEQDLAVSKVQITCENDTSTERRTFIPLYFQDKTKLRLLSY